MELGEKIEHCVFTKDDVVRDAKTIRNRIPTSISFVLYHISQETVKMGIMVLVWSVHVVEAAQSKHSQTPLEYSSLERYHKVVYKVIGIKGLVKECQLMV